MAGVNIKNLTNVTAISDNDYIIVEQSTGTKKATVADITKSSTSVYYGENSDVIELQKPEMIEKVNNIENNLINTITDQSRLTTDKTITGAINELFTNVSNGKSLLASAITDKGIPTLATDSFETMKNNILSIQSVVEKPEPVPPEETPPPVDDIKKEYINVYGKSNINIFHTLEGKTKNISFKSHDICGEYDNIDSYILNYHVNNYVPSNDIRYKEYNKQIKIPYPLCGTDLKQNELRQKEDGTFEFIKRCEISGESGEWSSSAQMLGARFGYGIANDNKKIYYIGGNNGSSIVAKNEVYDISSNSWSTLSNLPTARSYVNCAQYLGKIYCIGGNTGSSKTNKVDIYDIVTDTWSTGNSMPTARDSAITILYNNKIYCIGGNDGSRTNKLEIYDIESNSWTVGANMPTARYGFTAEIYNGKIYCIGGSSSSAYTNIVEVYDIKTNTWTTGYKPMPTTRIELSSAIYSNKIYCIGGYSGSAHVNKIEIYDISTGEWSTPETYLPINKSYFKSIVIDGNIYCIGGFNGGAINSGNIYKINNISSLDEDIIIPLDIDANFDIFKHVTSINCVDNFAPDISFDVMIEI